MLKGHIFIQHPQNSKGICWICSMKKIEHPCFVVHTDFRISTMKTRKKTRPGKARSKAPGIPT